MLQLVDPVHLLTGDHPVAPVRDHYQKVPAETCLAIQTKRRPEWLASCEGAKGGERGPDRGSNAEADRAVCPGGSKGGNGQPLQEPQQ
jgi:hypothetical protein